MKTFYPKTAAEALVWVRDHEHFEGYHSTRKAVQGLVLANDDEDCFIPFGLLSEEAMKPSDYSVTKRMFEPTEAGVKIIENSRHK